MLDIQIATHNLNQTAIINRACINIKGKPGKVK